MGKVNAILLPLLDRMDPNSSPTGLDSQPAKGYPQTSAAPPPVQDGSKPLPR